MKSHIIYYIINNNNIIITVYVNHLIINGYSHDQIRT